MIARSQRSRKKTHLPPPLAALAKKHYYYKNLMSKWFAKLIAQYRYD
jgi:hypothetical protein